MHDLRTRLAPNGSSCSDLPTATSLNFRLQANPDSVSAKLSSSIADFVPNLQDAFGQLTTAKPALTYVMRWVAISPPQPAERFRNLLEQLTLSRCCSRIPFRESRIRCNHRFPRLQPVTDLHRQQRQLGCDAKVLNRLAPTQALPFTMLISCACRIFKNTLRLPSSASRIKHSLRWSLYFQAGKLTGFRRLVLTG